MHKYTLPAAILILSACATSTGGGGTAVQRQTPNPTSYSAYSMEGGYQPGTIISREKNGTVVGFVVGRDRLLQNAADKAVLSIEDFGDAPQYTFDRTTTVKREISTTASVKKVDANLKVTLEKLSKAELVVNKGKRLAIAAGEIAILDLWRTLPKADLQTIRAAIDNGREVLFVTEVLEYQDAAMKVMWAQNVDASAKSEMLKFFDGKAQSAGDDSASLVVRYRSSTIVGYKALKIDKRRLEDAIKRSGSVRLFRDSDGDGFGASKVGLWSDASIPGYVANGDDCYDENASAKPNQTGWFESHRGDGSYDFNCDGKESTETVVQAFCGAYPRCDENKRIGWVGEVPAAGQRGRWLDDCDFTITGCKSEISQRTQRGR